MSEQPTAVPLPSRALMRLSGADARSFLNGVVTNDVHQVTAEQAIWSAFLTPQGKFLHEFFLVEGPDGALWMDCEGERRAHFKKRLAIYKLRADAEIAEADDLCVYALLGVRALGLLDLPALEGYARPLGDGAAFTDPRLGWLGARAVLPRETAEQTLQDAGFRLGETAEFERLRLSLGVPEGSGDLEPEKATLIESGFDELRGIDWNKGCFLGQELTARMKYRGLAKKRLIPVEIEGPPPEAGAQIRADGKPAGTLRSAVDGIGLALIRLDKLASGTPMTAGEATLTPRKPDWADF